MNNQRDLPAPTSPQLAPNGDEKLMTRINQQSKFQEIIKGYRPREPTCPVLKFLKSVWRENLQMRIGIQKQIHLLFLILLFWTKKRAFLSLTRTNGVRSKTNGVQRSANGKQPQRSRQPASIQQHGRERSVFVLLFCLALFAFTTLPPPLRPRCGRTP